MSEAEDRERLRYLQLKAKAAQAETEEAIPLAPAPTVAPEIPSRTESFLRGAGQGFTFGQGENINGLIQALGEKYLPESLGGGGETSKKKSLADLFLKNKGTFARENDAAWNAHPWMYGGGNALGIGSTMLLPFGASTRAIAPAADMAGLGSKAGTLADIALASGRSADLGSRAASLGQLMRGGAQSGLLWGGAAGVGSGLGDLLQGNYGRFAGDVAANAIPASLLGGAIAPIPKVLGAAAPGLASFAYRRAVKAAGPMFNDVRALLTSGRLEPVGKKLMEMGLIRNGAGVEEIANAVENAANSRGGDVHSILGELDALQAPTVQSAAPQAPATLQQLALPQGGLTRLPPALEGRPTGLDFGNFPGGNEVIPPGGTVNQRMPGLASAAAEELPGFNPVQVGARLREELLNPLRDQPALQSLAPGLRQEIQNLEGLGDKRLTFQRANDIKRGYDKLLDWTKEQTPAKELLKQVRSVINEEIEKHADAAATATGDPDLINRFRSAKQDYRDLRQVADFAKDMVARREARNFASPTDTGMGIASALAAIASGHPAMGAVTGLAVAAASKLARERGNSVAANLALGLSQRLAIPGNLAELATRQAGAWPVRLQGQRVLSDLLGGANPYPMLLGADSRATP